MHNLLCYMIEDFIDYNKNNSKSIYSRQMNNVAAHVLEYGLLEICTPRQVGKTTVIKTYSNKYNSMVICGNTYQEKEYSNKNAIAFPKITNGYFFRGKTVSDIIFLDEVGVDKFLQQIDLNRPPFSVNTMLISFLTK